MNPDGDANRENGAVPQETVGVVLLLQRQILELPNT